MRILFCSIFAVIVTQATAGLAQPFGAVYGPGGRYGATRAYSYHHASTAAEGYQRGMADVIRSTGTYNLLTSEAMKNVEDARKKYIENRLQGTDTYFEMRRLNKQARQAETGPRPTQNDVIRYAQERAPDRLSPSEVDPLTGGIAWPSLLQEDTFKTAREKLNELYEKRAGRGSLTASELNQVSQLIASMDETLQKNYVGRVPPMLYAPAKSFLKSLSYESYLPAG